MRHVRRLPLHDIFYNVSKLYFFKAFNIILSRRPDTDCHATAGRQFLLQLTFRCYQKFLNCIILRILIIAGACSISVYSCDITSLGQKAKADFCYSWIFICYPANKPLIFYFRLPGHGDEISRQSDKRISGDEIKSDTHLN